MKKIVLIISICLLWSNLYAGWYDNQLNQNKSYENQNNNKEQPQRGYEKPGDDNYLNQQTDEMTYGKNNSYQGSRPGDDDYSDRLTQDLINK